MSHPITLSLQTTFSAPPIYTVNHHSNCPVGSLIQIEAVAMEMTISVIILPLISHFQLIILLPRWRDCKLCNSEGDRDCFIFIKSSCHPQKRKNSLQKNTCRKLSNTCDSEGGGVFCNIEVSSMNKKKIPSRKTLVRNYPTLEQFHLYIYIYI